MMSNMRRQKKNENLTESEIINDILSTSLNEGVLSGSAVIQKLKDYAKRGLLTAAIMCAVLPNLNATQRAEAEAIGKQNGIESTSTNVVSPDEINITCIVVRSHGKDAKEAKEVAKKAIYDFCKENNETDPGLVRAKVISMSQMSRMTRANGTQTLTTTDVSAAVEFVLVTEKNYGDKVIYITVD